MNTKTYEPKDIEQKWYQTWEKANYFCPSGNGDPYCIVIPPPNVTGTLHMGHGFQQSIMDALIRYHRMRGFNTLWQVGLDHAGIATQIVVEQKLKVEGQDRHELGREKFVEKIWEWKKYSGDTISKQERRLGVSADWSRERFTMDPGLAKAVQQVFIQLYTEGLIYRGKKLVNWDPVLNTAISDLEVVSEDRNGSLWYIRYPIVDSDESLIVATTRPETMLGDVAIAVNPTDERYQHLIGKKAKLPLADRVISIVADDYVDKEFGTGCVKITPAHDFNDYALGLRHNLPQINIFTKDAKINENAPKAYQGLDRFEAREQIIADLTALGLLIKTEKHTLKIPICERSGAIIEPYLTDQWFLNAKALAGPAINAVKEQKIKFYPSNWSKTYFLWLENIEDWCISRQLWWGHRIPAWYDDKGHVYVGNNEAEVREKYKLNTANLKQDEDVLDTWFSSALWPFSTLGWPEQTLELKTFYPTNVLVTGFDIIFFWVARMVMMGLKFIGDVPFKNVYITGLIRDSHGHKMSKSKGNILDPVDLIDGISLEKLIAKRTTYLMKPQLAKEIEKKTRAEFPEGIAAYGADALRFTFCALASTSRDINFDVARLEGYRNFCTKLWNATRYVLMQLDNFNYADQDIEFSLADKWIQSEMQKTLQIISSEFANYRFDLIAQAIYDFTWHQFCDWYLELSKPCLTSPASSNAQKQGARITLITILEALLRVIHPFMPFITEELWQEVTKYLPSKDKTIMLTKYPEYSEAKISQNASDEIEWLKKVIIAIRNIRGEMHISPAKLLPILLSKGTAADKTRVAEHAQYLKTLAKLDKIDWVIKDNIPLAATAIIDELELHIPLADLIDLKAEATRLNKEIAKLTVEIDRAQVKLTNQSYLTKAPAAVVAKEQARLKECQINLDKLKAQLAKLERH
ncbi:MAG: valine--tRNA ligase [Gammaproteobacteria bacterium]|nr:valine--tRNA ligase [Gammaproteobacteria bacterium]